MKLFCRRFARMNADQEKQKRNHKGHEGTQRNTKEIDRICSDQCLSVLISGGILAFQYSTLTKKSPLAGAVAAAAERSRSSRMRRTSATERLPLPTMRNVPTRLRTMW